MTEAESYINAATGINYSDTYTSLNVDKKGILKMAASSMAAMMVINYDFSGFNSREEAETRLDVLRDMFRMAMEILSAKTATDFVSRA